MVVTVEHVYFQCAKAIVRSNLWDASRQVDRKSLPTAGMILAELTGGKMTPPPTTAPRPSASRRTLY